MPKTKKARAAGRFGARYGRRVRLKIGDIESTQRKKQPCMFCDGSAKREANGIWTCNKCKKTFAANTYITVKPE